MRRLLLIVGIASLAALAWSGMGLAGDSALKGEIKIDGSSTVYLISEAAATRFRKLHPKVNITVGIGGTGGGFKKFYNGETDISDASRRIKPNEVDECKKMGIEYVELQVAWDGLAVVIHKENDWATKMTVEQLKKIWHPDTAAKKWSDVDPNWPAEEIKLYGPGPDSGTFDYFTEVINGKERLSRRDFVADENDNALVQGVARNKTALGYFGLAYFEANKDKLQVVAVKGKGQKDYVIPTQKSVLEGDYTPLGRPLFIYVKKASLARPEIREFADYYTRRCKDLAEAVKYVPLDNRQQIRERKKLTTALKGI
ncbi:MAG: PstS family phosphate ABC transporter substrate-binding protein [Planctomycetes bacterium]|nr:PstS family phosphate ABC transporter substrate-binding protein [Planctomycetota bacterium]